MTVTTPLISSAGLAGPCELALADLLDVVVIEPDGRVLVALVDVLAALRLDRRAEILIADLAGRKRVAFTVRDVLSADDVFVQIDVVDGLPVARLTASTRSLPTDVLVSVTALTFQGFVGGT